jgi:hypothetical protein
MRRFIALILIGTVVVSACGSSAATNAPALTNARP